MRFPTDFPTVSGSTARVPEIVRLLKKRSVTMDLSQLGKNLNSALNLNDNLAKMQCKRVQHCSISDSLSKQNTREIEMSAKLHLHRI